MRRYFRWALRVFAQFVVAGGFTRALDAWIVDLDPPWQLTVRAHVQAGCPAGLRADPAVARRPEGAPTGRRGDNKE